MHRRLIALRIWLWGALAWLIWGVINKSTSAVNRLRWTQFRLYQFKVRPDDVFIVTYPKSGTTWMQMIAWQLKSSGDTNFRHIDDVVPWIERCDEQDLPRLEAIPSPRFFKSHLPYEAVPPGAKYIYVARNLKDVAVSYYYHQIMVEGFRGGLNGFVRMLVKGRTGGGSWARHLMPWLKHRNDPSVLFLTYEQMKKDLAGTIRKVAQFSGIALDESKLPLLKEFCGVDFMKKHDVKFDPRLMRQGQFIRKGATGEGLRELDATLQAELASEEERVLRRARELDPSGGLEQLLLGVVEESGLVDAGGSEPLRKSA